MGADSRDGLDDRPRVHATADLRIADLSFMAIDTSGTSNASATMFGAKAPDMTLVAAKAAPSDPEPRQTGGGAR